MMDDTGAHATQPPTPPHTQRKAHPPQPPTPRHTKEKEHPPQPLHPLTPRRRKTPTTAPTPPLAYGKGGAGQCVAALQANEHNGKFLPARSTHDGPLRVESPPPEGLQVQQEKVVLRGIASVPTPPQSTTPPRTLPHCKPNHRASSSHPTPHSLPSPFTHRLPTHLMFYKFLNSYLEINGSCDLAFRLAPRNT
ncbi:uncharacterized protein LOC126991673 [Eriocheir sinensis]|uniref:uncharacterized protein LOC126991673 n=1 Tax=Eriocheir sinensis TaxID=95602 RepID=UPI0021C9BC09|nr:uncharacterized protein LOC126991673 [Eriocheir sinensis]